MPSVKLRRVQTTSVREMLAKGTLPEAEVGLLRKHGDELGWGSREKNFLMDMTVDTLEAELAHTIYEVRVRSMCHCQAVTADYLEINERFQMNQCLLVMGDVGVALEPWVQLLQPAVNFFDRQFNVLFVEIPVLKYNPSKWLQHGPPIVRGALKFMCVQSCTALATGIGASVAVQALCEEGKLFRKTHHFLNVNFPKGTTERVPIDMEALEAALRDLSRPLQLWFAYQDEPGVYDRSGERPEWKASYEMSRLQARVESLRKQGTKASWDEIIITDYLNIGTVGRGGEESETPPRIQRRRFDKLELFEFSDEYLSSLDTYFRIVPSAAQVDLIQGLFVPVSKDEQKLLVMSREDLPELPAIRKLKVGPTQQDRFVMATKNKQRLLALNHGAFRVLDGQQPLALQDVGMGSSFSRADMHALEETPSAYRLVTSTSVPALLPPISSGSSFPGSWSNRSQSHSTTRDRSRATSKSWLLPDKDEDDEQFADTFFALPKREKTPKSDIHDSSDEEEESYQRDWACLRGATSWKEWSSAKRAMRERGMGY